MKKGCVVSLIVAGSIIVFLLIMFSWGKGMYNSMVTQEEGVSSAWSIIAKTKCTIIQNEMCS